MWPPIENALEDEAEQQVEDDQAAMFVSNGLIPRRRSSTAAAPIRPKTAPDAPTVTESGETISAPSDPAKQRHRVDQGEATEADRGSSICPSRYSRYMLKPMCSRPACRKPLVTIRQ